MNIKNDKIKKIAEKCILVMSVLSLVVMIGTVLCAAAYTVPISDDFWYARSGIGVKGIINRFIVAVKFSYEIYTNDQGTYFTSFIGSFFNPVISGGFAGMRVVMIVNAVLAFAAILSFVYVALKRLRVESMTARMFILAAVIFVLTAYTAFQEIFNWFVGASVYGIPFSMGIIAVTLLIAVTKPEGSAESKKAKALYVLAAILGFCAVGASLAVTGTICWLVLSVVVFFWIKDKKLSRKNLSVFLTCLGGALINVAAPGNYVRLEKESGNSFSFFEGIKYTWDYFTYALRWLFSNKNYGCVFIALILAGFIIFGRDKIEEIAGNRKFVTSYLILSAMLLFTPFVTIFPVLMGYGVEWMPNRCFYILIVIMDIALGNLALVIGALLSYLSKDKAKKSAPVILAAALLILFITTPFNVREYIFLKMDKQLVTGEIRDNYSKTKDMIDGFADMQGQDVEVDVPTDPEEIRNFYCFFLTDDPNSSINADIARAYGLNSIVNTRKEE